MIYICGLFVYNIQQLDFNITPVVKHFDEALTCCLYLNSHDLLFFIHPQIMVMIMEIAKATVFTIWLEMETAILTLTLLKVRKGSLLLL